VTEDTCCWTLVIALLLDPGSLFIRNKNAPGTILDSTKSSRGKKKKMKICCSIEKSSNVDAVKDEMDNFNVSTYNCKIEKSRVS
ncbi:unnamed protein product, partial [Larinioides sclopetarius]